MELSQATLKFGSVVVGQSETELITLTNTGQSSVTVSAMTVSNSAFAVSGLSLPAVVAAGQAVSFNVNFTPTENGWVGANVTLTNNSSSPSLRLSVSGTGVTSESLTASPANLSFGQVAVGSSATLPLVLKNDVTWKVTLSGLQVVGSGFSVSGATFPVVLSPGQSVSLNVTFAPPAAGLSGGNVSVSKTNLYIPLSGTGTTSTATGQLGVSPATLSFGSVDVGSSTTLPASLTATGGNVTISSASSNSAQYSIAGTSFPVTINAGQSVSVNVVFAPTGTGAASGTLTFNSNASTSTTAESLTGTGVTPQYSVNLSWAASTSSVAGYNVYRGTAVGSYSKINPSLDAATSYSDSTVASGVTYYYAATSVTSSGEESAYSSPVQVSVP